MRNRADQTAYIRAEVELALGAEMAEAGHAADCSVTPHGFPQGRCSSVTDIHRAGCGRLSLTVAFWAGHVLRLTHRCSPGRLRWHIPEHGISRVLEVQLGFFLEELLHYGDRWRGASG